MKDYWNNSNEVQPKKLETQEMFKEPSFLEVVSNRIYFYGEIEREKVLQLNKKIREMNNEYLLLRGNLALEELPKIYLHINSYGGSFFSGLSVMDSILQSQLPIITIVDGCCASAATLFSVVGTERLIHKHAFMLIHQISSFCWGKFSEFEDEMENLKRLMATLKGIYKQYTKIPMKKIEEIVKHDLWFDAETCLQYGLVDSIIK